MVNMRGVNLFFDYRKVKGKKVCNFQKLESWFFKLYFGG